MTIKQIEFFLRLSNNLNFAKTAKEMYTTQPTVTREIQALEHDLGVRLFVRSNRSVELTREGEILKKELQPVYMNLTNAIEKIKNQRARFQEQLRVGFCNIASVQLLPEAIRIFHKRYPEVQIKIVSKDLGSLCSMYEAGELDVFLGMRSSMKKGPGDFCEKLYDGRMVLVVSKEHPLFERQKVHFAEINGQTVFVQEHSQIPLSMIKTEEQLRKACPDSMVMYCRDINEMHILILAGVGIAVLPQYSIQPSETCRHIELEDSLEETGDIDYYLMRKKECRKYLKSFTRILKEVYQSEA